MLAIKTPIVPFHTWLPAAHVEAPTAGSVLLAGVLDPRREAASPKSAPRPVALTVTVATLATVAFGVVAEPLLQLAGNARMLGAG